MTSISRKIILKLQAYYFNMKLRLYGFLKLPAQTEKERQIFKAIFDKAGAGKGLRIFEWGSGYSTLYYARYLNGNGVDFEWHSIDNNRAWHERVKEFVKKENLQSKVYLHLMEFMPFWEKPGWGAVPPPCGQFAPSSDNEKDYVDYPRRLGKKFDVIIVDARFRRRCIQIARDVLQTDGVVVLHDAHKKQYHDGLESYTYKRFIESGTWYPLQEKPNRIWVGCVENSTIFKMLNVF
jgi:predicted O-methyltransferase YrrM